MVDQLFESEKALKIINACKLVITNGPKALSVSNGTPLRTTARRLIALPFAP